ncbi:MAG: hypothetical protein PHY77_07595 [Desulfotomaculaceae bacterium]|nr:hypothetical protein [Desulfotomaculaceae bacterium]
MIMNRAELLDAIRKNQNKIDSVKEMLTGVSEQSIAVERLAKMKNLLNTHNELIDLLG